MTACRASRVMPGATRRRRVRRALAQFARTARSKEVVPASGVARVCCSAALSRADVGRARRLSPPCARSGLRSRRAQNTSTKWIAGVPPNLGVGAGVGSVVVRRPRWRVRYRLPSTQTSLRVGPLCRGRLRRATSRPSRRWAGANRRLALRVRERPDPRVGRGVRIMLGRRAPACASVGGRP
jgi:hypothetical protein